MKNLYAYEFNSLPPDIHTYTHPQTSNWEYFWREGSLMSLSSVMSSSATPWTIANQAFLSMEFSGQEYWSGLPFPFLGPCIT